MQHMEFHWIQYRMAWHLPYHLLAQLGTDRVIVSTMLWSVVGQHYLAM